MKQAKKILSKNGKQMFSARAAATRLSCAPDYIGKLCRDGKISGTQVNGAWFVYGASLESFESSRQEARAARSEELSILRRQELSDNGFMPTRGTSAAVSILHPSFIKVALASTAVGFIFIASVSLTQMLQATSKEPLSAAVGQLQSPFFGTGKQTSMAFSLKGFEDYLLNLFSSDLHVQVTVRSKSESAGSWTTPSPSFGVAPTSTPVEGVATVPEKGTDVVAKEQPQIIINPVVEHTVERVVVENGISPELLSSIVKELAIGSDGSIQYSRRGAFAASSTALVWDNQSGTLTVSGELHTNELCIQGVCITKEQLKNMLATTTPTP